jgi:hypothetical protein
MVKKGTPASPAMARASSVLPVPGAPASSTPLGMRPPSRRNFFGSLRKAMISSTSSLASSMPATSAKVTRLLPSLTRRARDFPKLIALPPPDWSWRMKNYEHREEEDHRQPGHQHVGEQPGALVLLVLHPDRVLRVGARQDLPLEVPVRRREGLAHLDGAVGELTPVGDVAVSFTGRTSTTWCCRTSFMNSLKATSWDV